MRFRQIHLDFHTSEHIPEVGADFNPEQFAAALHEGHVDSITLFSKCHHGWSYHPTRVNEQHPSLHFDLLGAQLDVCRELGVRAPIYVSAGLDEKEAVRHPEWLTRMPNEAPFWTPDFDSPGFHRLCFNTGYMDLLLAQIREVIEKYHPVELFLDITAPTPCLCSRCREDMRKRGLDPSNSADAELWGEEVFKQYAAKVGQLVDGYGENIAVFHNFGHLHCGRRDISDFQTHLELESLPTGGWGYDDFPFSASYAQTLGKEYLGMTGKFHKSWGEFGGFKHPNALLYETSLSAALGAGCSVGDQMHPRGAMDMTTYKLIGKAYGELEKKERWCKDTRAIADIGLLSAEAVGAHCGKRVPRTADIGANRMLLEGKYLYSVIDCDVDFSPFKLLIMPDMARVDKPLADKLKAYLAGGGKLLCSGESGLCTDSDEFAVDMGIKYRGRNPYKPTYMDSSDKLQTNNGILLMYAQSHLFDTVGAQRFCGLQNPYFNRTVQHFCSHIHTPNDCKDSGAGAAVTSNTAYIGWEIFSDYATMGALQCKELVTALIERLIGDKKTLATNLPDRAVTTLRVLPDGSLVNHLLFAHTTVRGRDTEVIQDLIALHGTQMQLRLADKPRSVTLQPQGTRIPFEYADGVLKYEVEQFTCHQMIVIE